MYFIPLAMMLRASGFVPEAWPAMTIRGFVGNLVPVILGNLIGGSVLVGQVCWAIHLRRLIRRAEACTPARGMLCERQPKVGVT